MKKTFERYLEDKATEKLAGEGYTKDQIEDLIEGWLENLEYDDFIKYGDEYGELRDMLASK